MCAVSMVTDYYKEKWPIFNPYVLPITPSQPDPLDTKVVITRKEWEHYQELKKRMEEYDARTGQPHCEKPDVEEWEKAVQEQYKIGDEDDKPSI